MLNQNYADAFGTGIAPVTLPNVYSSPPVHQRSQQITENNGHFLYPNSPQSPFQQNDAISLPPVAHPTHILSSSFSHKPENVNSSRPLNNDQGRKINVDLVERGEVYGRTSLYLRVLNPQNLISGCRERLQILLTGHHRVTSDEHLSGDMSNNGESSSDNDTLEILYSASFTEECYRNFRQQQGLFVELKDFPSYIEKEILGKDKISVELSAFGDMSTSKQVIESKVVLLQFVEITPYKRNVHISIQLNRGSDKQVCKHLTTQLRTLRVNHSEVVNAVFRCQEELKEKDKHLEILEKKLNEEKMKLEANDAIYRQRLEEEIIKERQRTDDSINDIKNEAKKISIDNREMTKRLQNQIATLEYENKDLNEKRLRHECTIRGQQEDNKRLEVNLQRTKDELQTHKREKDTSSEHRQELNASLQRMKGEIDALKQERLNMDQEMNKQNSLLQKTMEEKILRERDVSEKAALINRRESQVKTVSQELNKANNIIKQFQDENRKQNNRVKLAQEKISSQEHILEKKELEVEDVRNQLKDETEANRTWKHEKDHLIAENQKYIVEIDQVRRRMNTNDSVISWLNKQLTNAKIRDPGFRIAPPPKNISHAIGGDMSAQAMTTMQPSMATEQKNNKLVASTPIQNQEKLVDPNKTGKENKNDAEKNELDPKYLQPSTSKPGMPKSVSHEKGARRKTVLAVTKQQSVYFNDSNIQ